MGVWDIPMDLEYSAYRKSLKEQFKTAKDLGEKHCVKCGFCCYKRTCVPTPIELKKIAIFLRLSIKNTIKKYYCVDRQDSSNIYFVKPAGINQLDLLGRYIPSDRTYYEGKCIFLDKNNLCKIYSVRPNTARILECWNNNSEEIKLNRMKLMESWNNNNLKEIYPEYLETINNK